MDTNAEDMPELKATHEMLFEKALALEETIRDIDYQIERAMHAVAAGTDDIGHAMGVLTERRNAQLGRMFELGKVNAQIEDLENRMREQAERTQEQDAAQAWEEQLPQTEDHLDWLRPALNAPEPERQPVQEERHPHYEGEERTLEDMHREDREPEDYLDWWKR